MKREKIEKINRVLALCLLGILVFAPLLYVGVRSITPDGTLNVGAPLEVLFQPNNREVVINSLLLGAGVVICSTIFAFPIAFLMSKTELKKHKWLDIALMIPFMTPPYIGAMGWILAMQRNGYVEQIFPFLENVTPYFFSYVGMVLIMSLHIFPFIYLILRNTLSNIGGHLDEAGAVHGGTFGYRMRRITIPLFTSGYTMAALLVFVRTLGEFGTPVTLGNRIGFYVLTSEIHRHASIWPIDYSSASTLSFLLIGISLFIWYMQQWFAARRHDTVVSGKGQKTVTMPLGRFKICAWVFVLGILFLAVGVPYASVVSTAFLNVRGRGYALDNFTLSHFISLFTEGGGREALWNSIWLSLVAATISTLLATWFSILVTKRNRLIEKSIDFLSLAPNMVPAIVFVVGLILFWNSAALPLTFYNTWAMLVLTYVVLYLPFTVQNIKAIYGQFSQSLIQAAEVSGAKGFYLFRTIIFPLILPGILAGFMMTFIISMRELVGSLILRPPNMHTTATYIYSQFEQGSTSLGMAMALVTVLITVSFMVVVEKLKEHWARK